MSERPGNAFLKRLSAAAYDRLAPHLSQVELKSTDLLYRIGERLEWVYFPEQSVVSLLSTDAEGQSVETFMAGREGAVGMLEVCGSGIASLDGMVQVGGPAYRAPAAICRELVRSDPEFAESAWTLIELQASESRQSGLCLSFHGAEARLARWLLESHERSGGRNPMPMTQEFLSNMLGVQRTTVNAFAGLLQKAGLIEYSRGKVTLVDVEGLEHRACECRATVRELRERLRLSAAA